MTSNKRLSAWTVGAFLISFLSLLMFDRAYAATITVNSLNDPGASGICALRDAITAANTMTATNGCVKGTGTDTINFSVTGTIPLGGTLLTIDNTTPNSLTIDGTGQNITISGNNAVRVMQVNSGATLTVKNLTIADGNGTTGTPGFAAGGIFNQGVLTVTNSTFSDNSADLGGGIFNIGLTLTVTNSTFSGNNALLGGGVENQNMLTVTNSTFSDNSAEEDGGGIFNIGLTLTVTNSTFSGNSALAGGGGIFNGATTNLKSTILADSTSGGNCANAVGSITDQGYNISDDTTCGFAATGSANNGDGVDPQLAAGLASNGGPTQTIALLQRSPAIDAIPVADCTDQASPPNPITTDQRGFPRPDAGEAVCDIGAYESGSFAGKPGAANCRGVSVSALSNQFGTLTAAASALNFPNVKVLQSAIMAFCKR
jgi:hypothetical protein